MTAAERTGPPSETSPAPRLGLALRRVKYTLSKRMSPKLYWYLMGRLRPVPAVTSNYGSMSECLESGEGVVSILDKFNVIGPDMVTLHIGSGLGRVELHLARRVRQCYGVDISPSMVKRARSLVPAPNVEFVESDGKSLGVWSDEFFDLIYSFFVFQHMPRAQFYRYLEEAHAKLRPGGHLVFQILIDGDEVHPDPASSHPYGLRYFRFDDVKEALELAGFQNVQSTGLDDPAVNDPAVSSNDVVFCAAKGSA